MRETRPLLTSKGDDYIEKKGPCTRRNIIICIVIFLVLLTVGLLVGFLVDWDGDDDEVSIDRSNKEWQEAFLEIPSNESCKAISVAIGSTPHVAGYPEQVETGEYVYEFFESLPGFDVEIQTWEDTVLDHFISSSLKWTLNASEAEGTWEELDIAEEILPIDVDPDTNTSYAKAIWNAYSASGTVQGKVVYINFGRRSDYEDLINNENYTVNFTGKIGLVRYGNMGRSTKVKIAQEYGIIGLLMFSDPEQYAPSNSTEGYYPYGPWLPPSGVQRGSIKYASCPGNPDLDRMQRLCGIDTMEEALPTIPVMPLSYGNAEILFKTMDGEPAPDSWQGEINTTYIIDSEDFELELSVETDLRTDLLTKNVYGIIEGSEMPEQVVMIGAHRDAWVCGAQDDVSGTATIMEVARGFGELYDEGWRPRRTMIFASWDSEESGLIGSTNFGEDLGNYTIDALGEDTEIIAYVNLDMTTGDDIFGLQGNPLLGRVSTEAMMFTPIKNPRFSDVDTFYDKWLDQQSEWGILGQGSDHTVFAFYLGVAAMDTGFGGDRAWGAYHSMYDTIGWQEVVDPNWMLAEDIARYTGILSMKLLDSRVIPFDLEVFASVIKSWYTERLLPAIEEPENPNYFDCDVDDILGPNVTVTEMFMEALEEMENAAITLNTFILDLTNRTNGEDEGASSSDDDQDEEDDRAVEIINDFFSSLTKTFNYEPGLPQRTWHKNILWNTAMEDGPPNVFPYIWYALQYDCSEETLRMAFDTTQGFIDGATSALQDVYGEVNVTQS